MSRLSDAGAADGDWWQEHVRGMLGRQRDPQVHDDIWDYLEGTIDRRELMRRPAFRAAHLAEQRTTFVALEKNGGAAALRECVGELRRRTDADRARRDAVEEVLGSLPPERRDVAERLLARGRRD